MQNKDFIKILCVSSFITGMILGILPLIPKLTGLAFMLVMFFSAPFVIIYLYKLKLIKEIQMQQCLSFGSISGFCAFIGFTCIYFPIALILNLIFSINSFIWVKVLFTNIGFLIPMIFLTALLCGLMNMFSSFICSYLYDNFKQRLK